MQNITPFEKSLEQSPLGSEVSYKSSYDSSLLFSIARASKRQDIGIGAELPFYGVDIWNAYELSWLDSKGKPVVRVAEFSIPCDSANIVESKSFKLYLNSFNGTKFESPKQVQDILERDLSLAFGGNVALKIFKPHELNDAWRPMSGICLDDLDVEIEEYELNSELLKQADSSVSETLYSHLLKSNCPVTGQPDWATLEISYSGQKICHESLLKYIVSFRDHNEFHEQCVERIFCDIMRICMPNSLTVSARYTRRGGLDINPSRSTQLIAPINKRTFRQ